MKYSIKEYSNFIDFQEANCYYGLFFYVSHIHRIKSIKYLLPEIDISQAVVERT